MGWQFYCDKHGQEITSAAPAHILNDGENTGNVTPKAENVPIHQQKSQQTGAVSPTQLEIAQFLFEANKRNKTQQKQLERWQSVIRLHPGLLPDHVDAGSITTPFHRTRSGANKK